MERLVSLLILASTTVAVPARALPSCESVVPAAAPIAIAAGEVRTVGYGSGVIGSVRIPHAPPLTPPSTALEGDVVAAPVNLDFLGFLGGGSTTLRPVPLAVGPTSTSAGAQNFVAAAFTGHYKAVPRIRECASVRRPGKTIRFSHFEISLTGLLTPTVPGVPSAVFGHGVDVAVWPGDTTPE